MSDLEFIQYYHLLSPEARASVDQLLSAGQSNCESQEIHYDNGQAKTDPQHY